MTTSTASSSAVRARATSGSPLRIAVAGAGKMAGHHAMAIRNITSSVLAVVADPNEDAARRIAAIAPEARVASSLEAALSAAPVDVVHICTPPDTHAALAAVALRAGCHVYVEKPFTENVATARVILEQAEAQGLKVCAGHQLLFEPPALRLRSLLPCVGRVVHVESYFSFRPVRRNPDGKTPQRADLQLFDVLPHPVYLLLNFLEMITGLPSHTESVKDGPGGTVHVLVRSGDVTGTLVVTLHGRPVESFVRIVGTNGTLHGDFVRGTVQRLIGPGTSGIEKLLEPFRLGAQMSTGTVASMAGRVLKRQVSYPGLVEMFGAFYGAIANGEASPISPRSILDTVRVCEEIADSIHRTHGERSLVVRHGDGPRTVVTGGTGFLGREIVRELSSRGSPVCVLSRRTPAPWDRIEGVDYQITDLARPIAPGTLKHGDVVIHTAAETAGGWDEHRKNSIESTLNVLRAAADAGASRVIHVSSLAVLGRGRSRAVTEDDPLVHPSEPYGPYVWGKAEAEGEALKLASSAGLSLKIVRPGPIVDDREFDPPGRLGRRIGPLFVAAGWPGDRIGVVEVRFAAKLLAWMVEHFDEAPPVCNLLSPTLPTRRDLVRKLRESNPDLRVIWLPPPVLLPLSWLGMAVQKVLRPRRAAMNVAAAFATVPYDTSLVARLAQEPL